MKFQKLTALLLTAALSAGLLAGCGAQATGGQGADASPQKVQAETVKLSYVNWSEGIAMTHLAAAILEGKLGYRTELTMADAAPVFTSVANGSSDIFLDAWLPVTHESYMEKYGEKLDDLGVIYTGARIGLVVPAYVDIDSVEELAARKDEFGGRIVGIDSGAGIMSATEKAITEYGLGYDLMTGSGPTMTAALGKAIDAKEPIVVTGWAPHWKFARWELKFLDDPKGVYGASEDIHIVTREGFAQDMPEAAAFLENFTMNEQDLGTLMDAVENGEGEPLDLARAWMDEHGELVQGWLGE